MSRLGSRNFRSLLRPTYSSILISCNRPRLMSNVHAVAQAGFGEGTNELYDRARPSYQPEVLSHIRHAVKDKSPLNIVEIGSGTGIFTRALLAHPEWSSSVNKLKAVEPSSGMRDIFARTVMDERVELFEGSFQSTGVEDGWADMVVIAQAFHWCPNYDLASAEFARVLKPNGALVLVWNLEDREGARWVAQVRERIEQHEAGTPQFRLGLWRQTFDTASYKKFFNAPEEKEWSFPFLGSVDIVVDRACSKSYIAVLPEDEKKQVVSDVRDVVERGEGKVWVDKSKGIFEYPYKTYVMVAHKK